MSVYWYKKTENEIRTAHSDFNHRKDWTAKHVCRQATNERIELRRTFSHTNDHGRGYFASVVIVVRPPNGTTGEPDIRISMGGAAALSYEDWDDMQRAVAEVSARLV